MRFKNDLTAAAVWSLFDYNPETGEFRYKIRKGGMPSSLVTRMRMGSSTISRGSA